MIKLKNPYAEFPGYNCFGCSPHNQAGLKMEFYKEGDEIVSTWTPDPDFEGFHDILHGGIQATMMDEIASWLVFVILETAGVTYQLKTKYRKPVRISNGSITLRAKLVKQQRRVATMEVILMDGKGEICSEGQVEYFILTREKAEKEMHFPGLEAFLK